MGSFSKRMITAWVPLGDISPELGTLLVAKGSHKSQNFASIRDRYNYSQVGTDGVQSGWLDDDGDHFSRSSGLVRPSISCILYFHYYKSFRNQLSGSPRTF